MDRKRTPKWLLQRADNNRKNTQRTINACKQDGSGYTDPIADNGNTASTKPNAHNSHRGAREFKSYSSTTNTKRGLVNKLKNKRNTKKSKVSHDIGKNMSKKVAYTVVGIITATIALVGAIMVAMNLSNISFFYVSGHSMEPTLRNGQVAVLKYKKEIEPDQTVVFKEPLKWKEYGSNGTTHSDNYFIKRVVAVPGDEVFINKEGLFVNGEKSYGFREHNYKCKPAKEEGMHHILKQNQIFVVGDNANHSLDSLRVACLGEEDENVVFFSANEIIQHGNVVKTLR